jgi:hypothetical protein
MVWNYRSFINELINYYIGLHKVKQLNAKKQQDFRKAKRDNKNKHVFYNPDQLSLREPLFLEA